MRLLGHPVHVMLVHFPVAFWPAHFALHLFSAKLPPTIAAIGGFWLLVAATAIGWLALATGAMDLIALVPQSAEASGARGPRRAGLGAGAPAESASGTTRSTSKLKLALIHAGLNGAALIAFTVIAALEYSRYPAIEHGPAFLALEGALLALMFAGNFFGGAIVWRGAEP